VPLTDTAELASHVFEVVRPALVKEVQNGDIIVAGRNFGCGSSREHAPKAIRHSGVAAVLADCFARIFYRKAINVGLLVVQIPGISKDFTEQDRAEIDMKKGIVRNAATQAEYTFQPYDDFIVEMIDSGCIIDCAKKLLSGQRN
jgi:3-isopropylmalate/(R)-2-methylmalate dehydratase small subunit